jgi:hypothetical protein
MTMTTAERSSLEVPQRERFGWTAAGERDAIDDEDDAACVSISAIVPADVDVASLCEGLASPSTGRPEGERRDEAPRLVGEGEGVGEEDIVVWWRRPSHFHA